MLGTITGEIRRLEALTGRYLHLSRPRTPQISTVDPEHMIAELLHTERPALDQAGIAIDFNASTEGPARLDADAVSRAVRNLVRNASEAGATELDLRLLCSKTRLTLTVTDNGPGLTDEQLERAFDPFFTTKARGTGLGLAISRQELEEVAGRLDYDPSYRGGARFILTVPLDAEGGS